MYTVENITTHHNHVWRNGDSCSAQTSKIELLHEIKTSGKTGYWLKKGESLFAEELAKQGLIKLCCDNKAATIIILE